MVKLPEGMTYTSVSFERWLTPRQDVDFTDPKREDRDKTPLEIGIKRLGGLPGSRRWASPRKIRRFNHEKKHHHGDFYMGLLG